MVSILESHTPRLTCYSCDKEIQETSKHCLCSEIFRYCDQKCYKKDFKRHKAVHILLELKKGNERSLNRYDSPICFHPSCRAKLLPKIITKAVVKCEKCRTALYCNTTCKEKDADNHGVKDCLALEELQKKDIQRERAERVEKNYRKALEFNQDSKCTNFKFYSRNYLNPIMIRVAFPTRELKDAFIKKFSQGVFYETRQEPNAVFFNVDDLMNFLEFDTNSGESWEAITMLQTHCARKSRLINSSQSEKRQTGRREEAKEDFVDLTGSKT